MKGARYQRGIGIPAALFVITLLATLAVAINELVSQNAQTFQEEVLLTRAFYAAESGAGLGLSALFPPAGFPQYADAAGLGGAAACALVTEVYSFTAAGLNACTASVSCSVDATFEGVDYYTITSAGSCDGVTRTVQVRTSFEP
jgi:MSHA biogenesis protein MshP